MNKKRKRCELNTSLASHGKIYIAASYYAKPLNLCPEGGIIMSGNETITLTPDELQLLLESMGDKEFILTVPLYLDDLNEEEINAEREAF